MYKGNTKIYGGIYRIMCIDMWIYIPDGWYSSYRNKNIYNFYKFYVPQYLEPLRMKIDIILNEKFVDYHMY